MIVIRHSSLKRNIRPKFGRTSVLVRPVCQNIRLRPNIVRGMFGASLSPIMQHWLVQPSSASLSFLSTVSSVASVAGSSSRFTVCCLEVPNSSSKDCLSSLHVFLSSTICRVNIAFSRLKVSFCNSSKRRFRCRWCCCSSIFLQTKTSWKITPHLQQDITVFEPQGYVIKLIPSNGIQYKYAYTLLVQNSLDHVLVQLSVVYVLTVSSYDCFSSLCISLSSLCMSTSSEYIFLSSEFSRYSTAFSCQHHIFTLQNLERV